MMAFDSIKVIDPNMPFLLLCSVELFEAYVADCSLLETLLS